MTVLNYLDSPGIHQQGVTWCMDDALKLSLIRVKPRSLYLGLNLILIQCLFLFMMDKTSYSWSYWCSL